MVESKMHNKQSMEDILSSIRQIIIDRESEYIRSNSSLDNEKVHDETTKVNKVNEKPSDDILDLTNEVNEFGEIINIKNNPTSQKNEIINNEVFTNKTIKNKQSEELIYLLENLLNNLRNKSIDASTENFSLESLDERIRNLLKPMLEEWLNNNLQLIVEKIVEQEIQILKSVFKSNS
tara:strand:+ start:516 stop:1049 length:534 start_codon:yes stop_codon:yes gene_type:complete